MHLLHVQPHQWKILNHAVAGGGKTKLDELLLPFSANPSITITVVQEKSHIVFFGKENAIDSAYQYFENCLASDVCDLQLEEYVV